MAIQFENGLVLPVQDSENQNGFLPTYNQSRNKVFNNLRSQLHVTRNSVANNTIANTLDVQDILNTQNQGVRVVDQRIGEGRYAVNAREAIVELTIPVLFDNTTTVAELIPFDTVALEGIGITDELVADGPVFRIPISDTSIISVTTTVELASNPGGDITFSIETRRLTNTSPNLNESEIINAIYYRRLNGDGPVTNTIEGTSTITLGATEATSQKVVVLLQRDSVSDIVPIISVRLRIVMIAAV